MENIIAITTIALIIGLAVTYIIHQKKKGVKCIGCPSAKTCACNGKCSDYMQNRSTEF